MSRKKVEYITCINCGNKKAVVIYNPKTDKRAGYHCPCLEPGRDTKDTKLDNPKPNSGSYIKETKYVKHSACDMDWQKKK